jgi:CubicO group peptidase (beta-lactamase class C family)
MPKDAVFRIYSMTKPIVSVAAMILAEEGRLLLADPVAKYIPAFAAPKVAVCSGGGLNVVAAEREMTIHDLLRHTSGIGYAFTGTTELHRLYEEAQLYDRSRSNAEAAEKLATLPLFHQPGTHFEYGHSTDVLGRIIEIISGQSLRAFLQGRILGPLAMRDTDFFSPPPLHNRLAQPFPFDPESGAAVALFDPRQVPTYESGGGGLVSTARDYARFCQMLLDGGRLGEVRLLSRKTVAYMTADHLGAIPRTSVLLEPGHGFGLGFSVRLETGLAARPLSRGSFLWGGIAGTTFWIDPSERLFAMLLIQAPGQRDYYRSLFRTLVYAAFDD